MVEDHRHLGDGQFDADILGDLPDLDRGRGGQRCVVLVGHGDRCVTDSHSADVALLIHGHNRGIRGRPDDVVGIGGAGVVGRIKGKGLAKGHGRRLRPYVQRRRRHPDRGGERRRGLEGAGRGRRASPCGGCWGYAEGRQRQSADSRQRHRAELSMGHLDLTELTNG